MKFPRIIKVFKVRINYKSGIQEVIKVKKFEIKNDFSSATWTIHSAKNRALAIGLQNIESVYQIGWSYGIIWE